MNRLCPNRSCGCSRPRSRITPEIRRLSCESTSIRRSTGFLGKWRTTETTISGCGSASLDCRSYLSDATFSPAKDPWPVSQIYNFLGEFVLDNGLLAGWQQTFPLAGAPSGTSETRFPDPVTNRFPRVGDVEQAAVDASIVHFTCHGGLKDAGTEGGSFWTLNHKQPTNPQFKIHAPIVRALKTKLPKTQPLIFGNACGSSGQATGTGGLVNSFGALFVQSGASAFVGTFAPIAKVRAIEFATQFYQHLLIDGESVSTALWRAKQHFHDTTPQDPSSLFYCQYGLPGSRYAL